MENLYGLIGEKLGHTFSPQIHNKILEETHTKGHYGLFEVKKERLQDVVSGLKALGYRGVNVTIPYKLDIIRYLDALSPEALKIGAVNVVSIDKNGMSTGYNTDYYGFGMMLDNANVKIEKETAVVLGTGGASKAVTQYLKDNGIKEIILVSRDIESARQKYPDDKIINYDELNKIGSCSVIINCTPTGMFPKTEFSPLDKKYLNKFSTAVDLIYNPSDTLFLKEARENGLKTLNGLYMLAAQAVKSQEIWNETEISSTVIDNILNMF
ncbi:MAG: shikimate dehydrogenase [Sedimentibacter sp.]